MGINGINQIMAEELVTEILIKVDIQPMTAAVYVRALNLKVLKVNI